MKRICAVMAVLVLAFCMFPVSAQSNQLGDVNGNGTIATDDALLALQAATRKANLDAGQSSAADVDENGQVTTNDALMILQYATQKITSFTQHVHTYVDYRCTGCGAVDKAHVYDYLLLWLRANGEASGEYIGFYYYDEDWNQYCLGYNESNDTLSISFLDVDEDYNYYFALDFNDTFADYEWYTAIHDEITEEAVAQAIGTMEPETFTTNSPLSCDVYEGTSGDRPQLLELGRLMSLMTLDWLDQLFAAYDMGITIADLGFSNLF